MVNMKYGPYNGCTSFFIIQALISAVIFLGNKKPARLCHTDIRMYFVITGRLLFPYHKNFFIAAHTSTYIFSMNKPMLRAYKSTRQERRMLYLRIQISLIKGDLFV